MYIHYGNGLCVNLSSFANGGSIARKNHPNHGRIIINNGIEHKLIFPDREIPEGYIICGLPWTTGQKQKHSEALKGENSPSYGKI